MLRFVTSWSNHYANPFFSNVALVGRQATGPPPTTESPTPAIATSSITS
jgi:hypothetical protein